MSKSLLIIACLGALVLAGCSGRRPRRCDQWGWYKPCDLVEGRYTGQGDCQSPCDPCNNAQPGQVVKREWAFPCQSEPMHTTTMPLPAYTLPGSEMVPVAPVAPPPAE